MKTMNSRELVESENGQLFLVQGDADGTYTLNVVTVARIGRYKRKWQAVAAGHGEGARPEVLDGLVVD